eukprot:2608654-Prorocentrum_lima.AAC.1
MPEHDEVPFLAPPGDVVVRYLGGTPNGWHIRKFLLRDGAGFGFPMQKNLLLPNWSTCHDILHRIADGLELAP